MKTVSVIVAGGKGERFWPYSRLNRPKQVLPLTSDNPMILDTINRLSDFSPVYVVANQSLCDSFRSILPSEVRYVVEPEARNTGPAIGLACAQIMHEMGDCVAIFESADHYYGDVDHYIQDLKKAVEYAKKNDSIVLIGIHPKVPHTGYGYIEMGSNVADEIYHVSQFQEKPELNTALQYIKQGNYVWNSGILVVKCSILLSEINQFMPDLSKFLNESLSNKMDPAFISGNFSNVERESIEVGVYEKSKKIVVLKSYFDWDDLGDFNSLEQMINGKDGNFYKGKIPPSVLESKNNIIVSDKKVALLGVDDLVVVETPDVLLICKRSDTQKIKDLLGTVEDEYR